MNNDTIDNLREALKHSPHNLPLKLHLANSLLELNRKKEAEKEYSSILAIDSSHHGAKLGLAQIHYLDGNYSTANVILEELIAENDKNTDVLLLHTRALIGEHAMAEAVKVYQKALAIDPHCGDPEIDERLRVTTDALGSGDETDDDALGMIERPAIDFSHVGGMDNVKKEIDLKIIKPLKHPELYEAYGKKIGGGILLYGPPGCGKTHIARATAGQVKAKFINVGLNDILDMWIGNSEKNLHAVFEQARANAPCVLFFDEIDALGASRNDMKQSAGRQLINQFLLELDGIDGNNDGVLILGATNTPWNLDPAFRRPGRFDRIIFVPPPDEAGREAIFRLQLDGKPTDAIDYGSLGKKTPEFSGADIAAVVDLTVEQKLEESFNQGLPQPIGTKDLIAATKKHKASTLEWFSTARNFALYANDTGLYDDILTYLKIKK